jgi:DNA transformation protein and related proteins
MGIKGSNMSPDSASLAAVIEEKLASIDGFRTKKMFGGFGLFHDDKMFGLIDSKGGVYMKGDKAKKAEFEAAGSVQHSRMPYFSLSVETVDNFDELHARVQ